MKELFNGAAPVIAAGALNLFFLVITLRTENRILRAIGELKDWTGEHHSLKVVCDERHADVTDRLRTLETRCTGPATRAARA